MDPDLHHRASSLVARAFERPVEERDSFVVEACGDDAELLAEVRSWLAADEESAEADEDFLESPVMARVDDPAFELKKVGPYILEETLGEGGMGVVYRALRKEPFEQQVALKLILPGLSSSAVVDRFGHERQILAQLEHPNIARLLDGGTTTAGRPYYVMEYVPGQRIDHYCDQRKLGVEERLALFTKVCEAVLFAHRRLVVHRDLKPANILVGEDGEPKLLDFGIAKLLDEEPGQATRLLGFGTPQYASPEQLSGEGLTTASDVYSLGVILYELLTGRRHDEEVTKSSEGRYPALMEHVPKNPSMQVDDPEVRRRLRGDLDAIARKALRPEVEKRYPSVDELLEDLERHRDGFPVGARKDGWTYHLGKTLRRNKLRILAVVGLLSLVTLLGLNQAEKQRRERQEEFSEELSDYIYDIFEKGSPREAGRVDPIVKDLLEQGVESLQGSFEEQPEIVAGFLGAIGRVHRHLGDYDEAERLLRESLDRRRERLPADHPQIAKSCNNLAIALREKFELDEAERLAEEAFEIYRKIDGDDGEDMVTAHRTLGAVRRARGHRDEAIQHYQRVLDLYSVHYPEPGAGRVLAHNNLGRVLSDAGRLDEADEVYRQGFDLVQELIQKAENPEDGKDVEANLSKLRGARTTLLFSRGHLELLKDDPTSAAWMLEESLRDRREVYRENHRRIAEVEHTVGRLRIAQGDYEAAAESLASALSFFVKLGEDHPAVSYVLRDQAHLAVAQGNLPEAVELAEQALAILNGRLDPDDWRVERARLQLQEIRALAEGPSLAEGLEPVG